MPWVTAPVFSRCSANRRGGLGGKGYSLAKAPHRTWARWPHQARCHAGARPVMLCFSPGSLTHKGRVEEGGDWVVRAQTPKDFPALLTRAAPKQRERTGVSTGAARGGEGKVGQAAARCREKGARERPQHAIAWVLNCIKTQASLHPTWLPLGLRGQCCSSKFNVGSQVDSLTVCQ